MLKNVSIYAIENPKDLLKLLIILLLFVLI